MNTNARTTSIRSSGAEAPLPFLPVGDRRRSAVVTLAAFAVAVLGAEWLVHQIAYVIAYGSRFNAVMQATPHRLYMAPEGITLAVAVVALLLLAAVLLHANSARRAELIAALPPRLRRFVPGPVVPIRFAGLVWTAGLLALLQMSIYVLQENAEARAEHLGLPGLSVLAPPEHWPVIPLHLLLALCGAFLLWTLAAVLRGSRVARLAAERIARLLIREASGTVTAPTQAAALICRPARGARRLRAPPARPALS